MGPLYTYVALLSTLGAGLDLDEVNHLIPNSSQNQAQADTSKVARRPQVWAIVIGVERYDDLAIPRPRGTVGDAGAVARWFGEAGWDRRHVLLLQDGGRLAPSPTDEIAQNPPPSLRPTRANLDWAVNRWLPPRIQAGDTIVIAYAGQCAPGQPTRPGARPNARLLPIDARAADLDGTAWRLDEQFDSLASTGRYQWLIWLDTAAEGRSLPVVNSPAGGNLGRALLERLCRWPGVSAWLAGEGKTLPEPRVGDPSAFTQGLLQALGSPRSPRNLLGCLHQLRADPNLKKQGFLTVGGLPPWQTLWAETIQPQPEPKPELVLQRGHADRISQLAFTPDAATLITSSMDSTLRFWRVNDRAMLRALTDHTIGVTRFALSPSGKQIASGDGNGQVRFFDLTSMQALGVSGPPAHLARIEDLAYSADGRSLISLDSQGQARLWTMTDAAPTPRALFNEPNAKVVLVRAAPSETPSEVAYATAREDGTVQFLTADGRTLRKLPSLSGRVTAMCFDSTGHQLLVGTELGELSAWTLDKGQSQGKVALSQAVAQVRPLGAGQAVVETSNRLTIVDLKGETRLLLDRVRIGSLEVSPDGRLIAVVSVRDGRILLWSRAGEEGLAWNPLALATHDAPGRALNLEFTPDGRQLASGDGDGGVRLWTLPEGRAVGQITARRGQIRTLAVSPRGRYLLQTTRDLTAQVWDLREGRGIVAVPGRWTSGTFVSEDPPRLAMSAEPNAGGDVVLLDVRRLAGSGQHLARPTNPARNREEKTVFDQVLASPDGSLIAARSLDDQEPLVCVWETRTAAVKAVFRDFQGSLTAVSFTPDGKRLLTGDGTGTIKLWDLARPGDQAVSVVKVKPQGEDDPAITCLGHHPSKADLVVAGTRGGSVLLGSLKPDGLQALGRLEGAVHAACFSADGKSVAAAGLDKLPRFWELDPRPTPIRWSGLTRHDEQIQSLLAWPGSSVIVSGSDDTSVRFWDLGKKSLLGTLSAVSTSGPGPKVAGGSEPAMQVEWVAFTPDGVFDASQGGERQVAWRVEDRLEPLEQSYERYHQFEVCANLSHGQPTQAPERPKVSPPRIALDPSGIADKPPRDVELMLAFEDGVDIQQVRLYHNGVPIPIKDARGVELPDQPASRTLAVRVRLRSGINRIYAMASRAGAIDGRSRVVEFKHDGPENPGRVHVLALGVSKYERNALRFADDDARSIADLLHGRVQDDPERAGVKEVILDDKVSEASVRQALLRIKRESLGHPEDKVVVFLAGHTGILENQFSLLLSSYPFPKEAPILVASRGAERDIVRDRGAVLPYAQIHGELARLDALNRLIIVDACESEAIQDDPGVLRIRRLMETGSRQARVAYVFAARRGEAATEAVDLEHGLMTYTLLRALGETGLKPPPDPSIFASNPSADLDGNTLLTTLELSQYIERVLPVLAEQYPLLVRRQALTVRPAQPPAQPDPTFDQRLKLQTSENNFTLMEIMSR